MDNKQSKKPELLLLKGVYLKNLIETVSDMPKDHLIDDQIYSDIPKRFLSIEQWPSNTNLKCWSCDQIPLSYPKFIPMNPINNSDGQLTCDVIGNFCEWNCAVRYILKELPQENQWDNLHLLTLVESKFSGAVKEKIPPSPTKTIMKCYCGNKGLTNKQWRDTLNTLINNHCLSEYKISHFKA